MEQSCSIGNDVVSKGLLFFGKEGPFGERKKGFLSYLERRDWWKPRQSRRNWMVRKMANSEKTKKALAQALKDLMQTQPFEKVNVSMICHACGIGRKTFYYHFQDKYHLVQWIFDTEFVEELQKIDQSDQWAWMDCICRCFYEQRGYYGQLLKYTGQNSFRTYFWEFLFSYGKEHHSLGHTEMAYAASREGLEMEEMEQFYSQFLNDAIVITIFRWVSHGAKLPPEQLMARMKGVWDVVLAHMTKVSQEQANREGKVTEKAPGDDRSEGKAQNNPSKRREKSEKFAHL